MPDVKARRILSALDWYGRYRDIADLARIISVPVVGGFLGFLVNGALGAVIGSVAAVVLVVLLFTTRLIADRLFPLPEVGAEPEYVNGEFAYGRSINGRLTASWASLNLTANNPGRWDERITGLRCDLSRKQWGIRKRVHTIQPEKSIDWLLPAKGTPQQQEFTFHKTFTEFGDAPRAAIGEELELTVTAELGSKHRVLRVEARLPRFLVKGPYPS